jgi:hypothetical protein
MACYATALLPVFFVLNQLPTQALLAVPWYVGYGAVLTYLISRYTYSANAFRSLLAAMIAPSGAYLACMFATNWTYALLVLGLPFFQEGTPN